jgi:hypothetical protein
MDSFTREFNTIKAEINNINQQQSKINVMRPTLFIRRGSLIQRMQELAAEATFVAAAAEQDAALATKMHKHDHMKYTKILNRCSDVSSRWIEHQIRSSAASSLADVSVADFPQNFSDVDRVPVAQARAANGGFINSYNSGSANFAAIDAVLTPVWPTSPDNHIYYVPDAGAFAFWIGPELFHGNIGRIFESAERPWHFKSCHFGPSCTKSVCLYYHDPKLCGGTNIRNYLNNIGRMINQYGLSSDRIGTKKIEAEDLSYFKDMLVHLLLCYFVLKKDRAEGHGPTPGRDVGGADEPWQQDRSRPESTEAGPGPELGPKKTT